MNLCQRENLYQVDLLSPAQHKITEAEYWLQKRGQKELEDINEQIIADGMNPMETTFQTRKQFVRNAVSEISSSAISFEDFQSQLFEKYKIESIHFLNKLSPRKIHFLFLLCQIILILVQEPKSIRRIFSRTVQVIYHIIHFQKFHIV